MAPRDAVRDEDHAVLVDLLSERIVGKAIGTVEVDDIAQLRRGRTPAPWPASSRPCCRPSPACPLARGARHLQRLGQAAALVELDVDDVEIALRAPRARRGRGCFRRRQPECRASNLPVSASSPRFERLLDQRHRKFARRFGKLVEILGHEALVGVDSEPGVGPGFADDRDPFAIGFEIAVELELDRLGKCQSLDLAASTAGSSAGRVKVVTSGFGRGTPASRQTGVPRARDFQLPQGAIERVARAAWRQADRCSSSRVSPSSISARDLLDRLEHVLLVVAEIIDAGRFAAADCVAFARSARRSTASPRTHNR